MKLFALFFVFACYSHFAFAQKENDQWYFGHHAALCFYSGITTIPTLPNLLDMPGGSSSVSDTSGRLLFYTDGLQVIDSLNNVMPNGNGLLGSSAATQSTLIVKHPTVEQLYFVFTIDPFTNGLCFSMVDMALNGGLGDVSLKNNLLLSNVCAKLTGIKTIDGSVWILTHRNNSDEYDAFKISSSGISTTPVVSHCGVSLSSNNEGQLKISPDAHHVAACYYNLNVVELCDFNWVTGVVSNPVTITGAFSIPDGLEFSPDGSKLYFTTWFPSKLFQVDVMAGNAAAIIASTTLVYASPSVIFNQMQLASNNKIYIAESFTNYIGVINNPNNSVANCNYVPQIFFLGATSLCENGVPNYLQKFKYNIHFAHTCFGDSTEFTMDLLFGQVAVQWNFDDINSGASNVSYSLSAQHFFTDTGTYTSSVIIYFLNGSTDTIKFPVSINFSPNTNLGNDTTLCIGTSLTLNAGAGNYKYLWQDGSVNQTLNVQSTGTYVCTVTNGSCSITDSIHVLFVPCNGPPFAAMSVSDSSFCEKQFVDFYDLSTNNPTNWQWTFTGAQPNTSTLQNPTGIFYPSYGSFDVTLIACNPVGCDTLYFPNFITEYQSPTAPSITQSNDTLYSNTNAANYQWYVNGGMINGATNSYYVITQPGSYFVYITDSNGCEAASNIVVVTGLTPGPSPGGEENIVIVPNPNNGKFEIVLNDKPFQNKIELKITDAFGQIVFQHSINNKRYSLSLPLKNGVYFVEVISDEKLYRKKMVVN